MAQLNLKLTLNQNGSITASWSPVSGTVRYEAYMYPVNEHYAIFNETNLTSTSYTSQGNLTANRQYQVIVTAYGQNVTLASDGAKILIPSDFYNNKPLDVPQNVRATADISSVTVSFSAVARATSYDILFDNTVYNVTSLSRRFTGLTPKSRHTYAVRAKNSSRTGAYSSKQTITTGVQMPAVPSNVKKTATETSVTISWGAVSGATGYDLLFNGTTYAVSGTSKSFTSLTAGRSYPFAVRSRNADGNSAYTPQASVTTPPRAPASISATSTANSVTISWNAVSGASGYLVRCGSASYDVSASGTSYTVTGLAQNTSYSYQICCKSADGTGNYSSSRTIKTLMQTPAVPVNIRKSATGTTATVSWDAVSGATGYSIQFNGSVYSTTATSKTFTGLTAGRSYSFKVCAKNGSVTGSYSADMTVTTAPVPPATVSATSTEDSVTVSWSAVSGAAGYTLSFGGTNYEMPATSTSYTLTGLKENTSYSYQVCSKSVDGSGSYSSAKSVKTLEQGLTVPTGISHRSTDTSVTVSWNAVTGALGYDVKFNGSVYSVTGTSREFTGLYSDRSYSYQIRSKKSSSRVGEYSAVQTVRTTPKAPSGISRTTSENSVTVSWSPVSGAASYDLLFNGKVYHVTGTSHTVTGLAANTSYTYQVRVNNADGSSAYCSAQTVKTAPLPPASATVTAGKDSVTVNWSAVTGAASYDVLFGGNVYRAYGTSYTVSRLTPGTSYTYQIRCNNADGSSSYGTPRTVTTIPNPPAAPGNISASSTVNSVTISWSAVSGATSYDVLLDNTEYHVTGTSRTITGLRSDTGYMYRVRANNAGGNGLYSSTYSIRTLAAPPAVPTNIRATAQSYAVTVSWNAVSGAASYDLAFNGTVYSVTGTSRTITGLNPSTSYSYQVRARNSGGTSSYSGTYRVTTLVAPPATPANVNAAASADTVTVSWSPVSGATGYRVEFNRVVYSVTGTSKGFTGLSSNTEYTYAVCACNAGGNSAYSALKTIRTLQVAPAVPGNVGALADTYAVNISWNAVEGADSYELLFAGTVYPLAGGYYRIEGLTPNTVYTYQVRAINGAGASAYSAPQTIRTRLEVPANVRAEATAKTVTVSFDPVEGATGYDIIFYHDVYYNITDPFKVFGELKPETEYEYAVRAKNEYVDSGYSKTQSVRTLRPGPGMPSDLTAAATMDCVILSWSPVEGAESYDIQFDGADYHVTESGTASYVSRNRMLSPAKAGGTGWEMAAAFDAAAVAAEHGEGKMYRIFMGLEPNREYSYCARANNSEGSSLYTPLKSVRTDFRKSSGLAQGGSRRRTYPDGRRTYTGNDPVNALTGAFLWSYTWLEDQGKDGLHFTAMYDSRRDARQDVLGRKWTHSLNYMLYMDEEYAYFSTPYDDVIPFVRNREDGSFLPVDGSVSYALEGKEDGAWCVRALDGTEYVFDSRLCLTRILENGLVSFRFQSDEAGQTTRIEGRHGAAMELTCTDGHITGVTDAMGNTVTFTYEGGKLLSAVNPDGRAMSFAYDDACNLLTITDFSGDVWLTNTYDLQGRVTEQLTAGRGRRHAAYDGENRVTSFTDEQGNVTRYTYDEAGHIISVSLDGKTVRNSYNENGQLTERTDTLGNVTKMEYDDHGRMNRVIHPDGTQERVTYNDRNQPLRVEGRDGTVNLYQYDEQGNLTGAQDERGNTSSYTYDENDNLTSFTDRSGNVWTYAYDEQNHLKQAADPEGNICLYTHDAIGRMTSYTSPGGRTVRYAYSAAGDLLSMEDGDGKVLFAYNAKGSRSEITDRMGNSQRLEYNETGQVSLVTDALGNEYRFGYDERGNLVTETDPLGYSVSSVYDASGNRISQTDRNGGVTSYAFDGENRLVQVRDAAGGTVSYAYDCMGQVTAVTDQLSRQRTYTYDQAGRVLTATDALGNSVCHTYDAAGNMLTRTDEDGNLVSYTYDAENRLLSIRTDAGTTSFTYDSLGRILSVTDTEGYTESAQYDSDDHLTKASDQEGRETAYAYDSMGRLSEETLPNGGKTSYTYDKNGNCIQVINAEGHGYHYEYDANNRLVKATDPLGQETAFAYDGRGQMTRVTDPNGGITEYTYDGNGNLTKETDPSGGEKTYVYDSLNRLTGSTDEEGNTWSCTYDGAGNRTSLTDANGNCRNYEYDANNRLIRVTDRNEDSLTLEYTNTGRVSAVTDMEGAVTGYQYDTLGRLTRISDALGHSLAFTYDSMGRLLTQTDANGNVTEYGYSPAGHLLWVKDGEGNTTAYTYNELGQVLTKKDALGNQVSYAYDLLGQVTSLTDALGNTTAFTYTADGRIATVENAEGGITRYGYDACGNLVQTEDPLGNVVEYEYDARNNRIRECLSESGEQRCITLYQYDKKGRMIKEIDPMLEERAYGYDGNDNMVSVRDEEQRETTVTYDLNNQPVSMAYSDGRTAAFRYNKRGELVEMQDWNGTTVLERDSLGRLTGVTDPGGRRTGFSYDAAGNRTGIRYPDGSAAAFAYDRNNRLLEVTEGAQIPGDGSGDAEGDPAGTAAEILARYGYDAAGNVTSVTQPDSTAVYAYNANRQPVKAAYRFGGGTAGNQAGIPTDTFLEENFTYDAMGRITGAQRTGSRAEFARTAAYAYDAAGQLVSYQNGQNLETYTYDALGNRITRSLNGIRKATCQYNALSQLTALSEDGVTYGFGYDRCGNLIQERRGEDLVRQYVYDATGRMALGKNLESGEETAYTYNALQMCVGNHQKLAAEGGFRTRQMQYVPDFLSATSNELMAYGTGGESIRTVFGHAYQRLNQTRTVGTQSLPDPMNVGAVGAVTGKTFFQSDIYGSPIFASDGQGVLQQYAEYDIWGGLNVGAESQAGSGSRLDGAILPGLEENLRFTSYRYDPVIGKYFAQARFYDGANGRMLGKDPVKRGLNPYRYCDDDPVDYVDPTGEILNIIGGAVLGGVFGGAGGLISSAISQKISGGKVDWKEAWGAAANGAITGAAQGGLLASGAGIPVALATNFLAGTAGSAAEQYISTGRVDTRKSITNGLNNAVSNLIYGTNPLGSVKEAFGRGFGAGAATSAINYISDLIGQKPVGSGVKAELLSGITGAAVSPFAAMRDPRRGCGSTSPFTFSLGYSTAKGYRYDTPQTTNQPQSQRRGFSLKAFLGETLLGGLTGGFTSAAFYGAGKGIERIKKSVWSRKSNIQTLENTGEIRYRRGEPVNPMEISYEMRLDPEGYAYAVAEKYGINLKGSGQKISIQIDNSLNRGVYGKSGEMNPTVIILGEAAFYDEATLANTIAHELSHCRDYLRGAGRLNPQLHKPHGQTDSLNISGGVRTVYGAGNALEAYIRGER